LQIITLAILTVLASACGRSDSMLEFDNTPPSVMDDGVYQYGATIDGEITWWTVHFDDVARTPDWSPGTEPPLSLSRAGRPR
jgi:hypothetical protein